MGSSNESEHVVDAFSQSIGEDKREEGRRDVKPGLDGADRLAGHPGQISELLLRKSALGAGDFQAVFQTRTVDRALRLLLF